MGRRQTALEDEAPFTGFSWCRQGRVLAKLALCSHVLPFASKWYNKRMHSSGPFRSKVGLLRAPLVTMFDDTLNYCFGSVLETMGTSVRDVIYARLEKKGVSLSDISAKFDDVVRLLTESFGGSARVIIYKTVMELHQQYSMRANFTYQDSLRDHLFLLRERVVPIT